jgi:hypothetical protein
MASSEERLHAALWAFHAAVQRRDGIESRVRSGDHQHELQKRSLRAAEAVVKARLELYRVLMADGWVPPPSIAFDVEYDHALLSQHSE